MNFPILNISDCISLLEDPKILNSISRDIKVPQAKITKKTIKMIQSYMMRLSTGEWKNFTYLIDQDIDTFMRFRICLFSIRFRVNQRRLKKLSDICFYKLSTDDIEYFRSLDIPNEIKN